MSELDNVRSRIAGIQLRQKARRSKVEADKADAKSRYRPLFEQTRQDFLAKLNEAPKTAELMSYTQFADHIGATWGSVKRWVHEGMPTELENGETHPRIRVADGIEWLEQNPKRSSSLRRENWVYFIEHPDGRIKIGVTVDPERRVFELSRGLRRAGQPPCRLLAKIRGDKPAELQLHESFREQRISDDAEWFRPTREMMAFIAVVARGQPPEKDGR